jgi:hypothetical protein
VIEAKAIKGPEMLREAAEEAARKWVFSPMKISGAPAKMQGVLIFSFALQ